MTTQGEWQLSYDSGGRVSQITGGGQTANYSYNSNGELTHASLDGDSGVVITTYAVSTGSSPSIGGSVSGGGSYVSGQTANLSANAEPGFLFVKWTGTGITGTNETSNPLSIAVDGAKSLTASFRLVDETADYTHWISALYPDAYDPTVLLGTSDNDGDGWINRHEFLMGFMPNDANDTFEVRLLGVGTDSVTLEYNRVRPTGTYLLSHSSNLVDWTDIGWLNPISPEEGHILNVNKPADVETGFYRVTFEPPP